MYDVNCFTFSYAVRKGNPVPSNKSTTILTNRTKGGDQMKRELIRKALLVAGLILKLILIFI